MIKKHYDIAYASEALSQINGSVYIKNSILMYLNAYGTDYDFCEAFLQQDMQGFITSVILRYCSFIYCSFNKSADFEELILWLKGYKDTTVYCDSFPTDFLNDLNFEPCFEICRKGALINEDNVQIFTDSSLFRKTAQLINSDKPKSYIDDFFLDMSHLSRHNYLKVAGYMIDNNPISVVGFADITPDESIINFVFTEEYFRGKGYSKQILNTVCSNPSVSYHLICSEINLDFYKKCGFSIFGKCLKFNF